MSYRIEKKERLFPAVQRIIHEEIDSTLARLSALSPKDIHEARRSLKRGRGVLRLLCHSLPRRLLDSEEDLFRNAGRQLAPERDARVAHRTLSKLRKFEDCPPRIYQKLARQLRSEETNSMLTSEQLKQLRSSLQNAKTRVLSWQSDHLTQSNIRQGFVQIYRRGRKGRKGASKMKNPDAFHAWRKHVKHLEHALCLLEVSWKKRARTTLKKVKSLGQYLGDAHDLAMLTTKLEHGPLEADPKHLQKIVKRASKCRIKAEKTALCLGKAIFQDKPARFLKQHIHS